MSTNSPLSYVARGLQQIAFAVKDLEAGQRFFNETMGVSRFCVIEDVGLKATEKTYRGRPVEHNFRLALAYCGDVQLELLQPVSGQTCYQDFIDRRGEGLHHLGFFLDELDQYEKALDELKAQNYSVLTSGKFGDAYYSYFDTEAAIGSIMEIIYIGPEVRELFARIKRGEF